MSHDHESDFALLLILSLAMFAGAFGAGYFPLLWNLNPTRLRAVSIFGAGVLIGAALIVIIPEGVQMWYSAQAALPAESSSAAHGDSEHEHHLEHAGHGAGADRHWQIGAALAAGFALMLVVDRLGGGYGHGASGVTRGSAAATTGLLGSVPSSGATVAPTAALLPSDAVGGGTRSRAAMLGLLVHAAVDGVALGAMVQTGRAGGSAQDGTMLIFAAIMLHKAPAAFGLVTYLVHCGDTLRAVKQQLLFFSLAAPAGALLTYYGLGLGLVAYQLTNIALIMLFSGGTFLFVATAHILPEIMHGAELTWRQTWLLVGGVLLPLILNMMGHRH